MCAGRLLVKASLKAANVGDLSEVLVLFPNKLPEHQGVSKAGKALHRTRIFRKGRPVRRMVKIRRTETVDELQGLLADHIKVPLEKLF